MSWDIFAMDLPPGVKSLDDIPNDYRPAPIGSRSAVTAKIKEAIPTADFDDPSWGVIQGDGWHIEVNIGSEEEACTGFALHVRGGDGAVAAVAAILDSVGIGALDTGSEGGVFIADKAVAGFRRWRGYRDAVAADFNGSTQASED